MGIFKRRSAEPAQPVALAASDEPTGDYSADVTPPARSTVLPVTMDRALGLSAVLRSVQILSGIGSGVGADAWRAGQIVAPEPALVAQPDPWRSRESFIERLIVDLATDGNFFILKHRTAGAVVALEALDPFAVHVHWNRDKTGKRTTKEYHYTGNGKTVRYAADDVEHGWFMETPGRTRSLSPIGWCRATLAGAIDLRDYADGWFRDGDVPSGVLSTDQPINAEDGKRVKQAWQDAGAADGGPSVRVLGRGLAYAPIRLNPADAQWLESQNASVVEVARMYGLPADYLLAVMESSSLTYTTLEMSDSRMVRTTLEPVYLRKIAAALTRCSPRGQTIRFRVRELAQPDAKTQAEIDEIYCRIGVYDRDYVRNRLAISGPVPALPAPTTPAQETTP